MIVVVMVVVDVEAGTGSCGGCTGTSLPTTAASDGSSSCAGGGFLIGGGGAGRFWLVFDPGQRK